MTKSIVTWAVAALFAVPAVPMFAKVPAAHRHATHAVAHKSLTSGKKHHHKHHKAKHTKLTTSARAGRHLSASVKHSARPTASVGHPQVRVTAPPMIDGMHT